MEGTHEGLWEKKHGLIPEHIPFKNIRTIILKNSCRNHEVILEQICLGDSWKISSKVPGKNLGIIIKELKEIFARTFERILTILRRKYTGDNS